MVGKTGFEPATSWSQTTCSTKLSHFPIDGALEGIRTPDLLVRSQTLYPTELRAQSYNQKNFIIIINGGSSGNRTSDTGIFSPLLYRLSYEAIWRSRRGSNPRSSAWQADVLTSCTTRPQWLREEDLNLWPLGYEPNELPNCSIPRYYMAEEKGFEPLRHLHDLSVFKTDPFNQTWVFLHNLNLSFQTTNWLYHIKFICVNIFLIYFKLIFLY